MKVQNFYVLILYFRSLYHQM